jgi:hypothetical protein
MSAKSVLILIGLVFLPSLLIGLHPATSESFQYDAVVSQLSAREGIVANAWDEPEAYRLRRLHPPLLSYIIRLNNSIFGDDAFGSRVFSIVFGSLTCLVVAISIVVLLPPLPGRFVGAVFGGWLICLLPVHLYVSRTSNWDAAYGFFAATALLCLASYVKNRVTIRLYAAALSGSLAFLTSELGLSLVPAFLFVMFWDARSGRLPRVFHRWTGVLLFVVVFLALVWPAGVFKLDLTRTLLYRWRDSVAEQRNLPWYMFYVMLFREAPAFTLAMVLGILATILPPVLRKSSRPAHDIPSSSVFIASLPFWIYVATAFLLSLKQRLVYVHHIADMLPPLVVGVGAGVVAWTGSLGKPARNLVLALGIATVALSIIATANPDPKIVGPQEHPGFLGVRDILRDHPGSRIYCYDTVVLKFYLPEARIEGGASRYWTPEKIEEARREKYDFLVFDRAVLNDDYPTAEIIIEAFAPDYTVGWVIKHRRSGEPVAWILRPER